MSSATRPSSLHMPRTLTRATLNTGTRQLADADADLAGVISRLGEPPLWGRRPGFATLVRIILEQQVSLAAAHATYRRLFNFLRGMTPKKIHAVQVSGLREFGLTRQKSRYCYGLAERILNGSLNLTAVARSSDDEGRQALMSVTGLGPWSVDIYYLMALRRPDIWPQGDLALAKALRELKRLEHLPTIEEQLDLAARWSPWRSVAVRILWVHYLSDKGLYTPSISSSTGQ
jgi:DNA-3-methyladenine glycosylase II